MPHIFLYHIKYSPLQHAHRRAQRRIQEFILGRPNQGPQSKVKGEARIEGTKCPSIEGDARVEDAKRSRIEEGKARTEGEARE